MQRPPLRAAFIVSLREIEEHPTGLRIGETVIAEPIRNPTPEQISEVMRSLRAIPSERRTEQSRDNGCKGDPESHRRGGRPKKGK